MLDGGTIAKAQGQEGGDSREARAMRAMEEDSAEEEDKAPAALLGPP